MKAFIFLGLAILLLEIMWNYPPLVNAYARDTFNGTIHFVWYMIKLTLIFFVGFLVGYIGTFVYVIYCHYGRTRRLPGITRDTPTNGGSRDLNASGDHEEFLDFPEVAMIDEDAPRTRHRRMISTMLRDQVPSTELIRDEVREALLESIKEEFCTPSPSRSPTEYRTPLPSPRSQEGEVDHQTGSAYFLNTVNVDNEQKSLMMESTSDVTPSVELDSDCQIQAVTKPASNKCLESSGNSQLHFRLQQFPRGLIKPCLSPKAMFLETYIRLLGISCAVSVDCFDTTGPWMTFDEEKVCGANECMKMLKDRLPNLTNMYTFHGDEHVTAWSIQLTLDHLSLCLTAWRWIVEDAEELRLCQPGWNEICKDFKQLSQSIKANLWSCGFSKKSYKELSLEISKDFDSLSLNLGKKPYIFGDTPTEIDCFAFSVLCQIMWGHESILREKLRESANLSEYCIRTRERLWPDWDDQLGLEDYLMHTNSDDVRSEDHILTETQTSKHSTSFRDQYYKLVPLDDCDSFTSDCLASSSICSHKNGAPPDERVLFCARCKVSTCQPSSDHPARLVVLYPDADAEYFDDELSDMQKISYSSHRGGATIL